MKKFASNKPNKFNKLKNKNKFNKLKNKNKINLKAIQMSKLITTSKSPSKRIKKLSNQIRMILKPDSSNESILNKRIINTNKDLNLDDLRQEFSDTNIALLIHISELNIKISSLIDKSIHTFQIVEFEDNFKTFSNQIYSKHPLITFDFSESSLNESSMSSIRALFNQFGKEHSEVKRCIHISVIGELIYLRHYCSNQEDTENNFKIGFKEIGPRLTLKLTD